MLLHAISPALNKHSVSFSVIPYLEHTEELLDRALFLLTAAATGLQGHPAGVVAAAAAEAAAGMLIMRRKRCCCLATRLTAAMMARMDGRKEGRAVVSGSVRRIFRAK